MANLSSQEQLGALLERWGHRARTPSAVGTPRPVTLTVGIATYNDFDGAYFTAHSLLLHHPEAMRDAEIVILDNHPEGSEAPSLAAMAADHPGSAHVRYVPYDAVRSTAVRDALFREASGEVVLVLDSHVLLAPGGLESLITFLQDPAHAHDMVQGPMTTTSGQEVAATHMTPDFRKGMYGVWGLDPRGKDPRADPFEIELQGLGLFAMRRDAWVGLNPRFRGFGGEEGYLQEKVRQRGGKVWCLPALRWQHRFLRPGGTPYPNQWEDRIHNYLVGWAEIGYDTGPLLEHFAEILGPSFAARHAAASAEVNHPLRCVDGVLLLSDDNRIAPWQTAREELAAIEVTALRVPVRGQGQAETAAALEDGLGMARYRGWRRVLILDESWRLDLGLAHQIARLTAGSAATDTLLLSQHAAPDGFLPGPIVTTSDPTPATSVSDWLAQRRAGVCDVVPPLASSRPAHPDLLGNHLGEVQVTTLSAGTWPVLYQRLVTEGLAQRAHQLPVIDRDGLSAAQNRRVDLTTALTRLAATPTDHPGPILLLQDDALLLRGWRDVLLRALQEAASTDWDVLSLAGGAGTSPQACLAGSSLLARRATGHAGCAMIVRRDSLPAVAAALASADHDDQPDPIGAGLDAAVASGSLCVLSIEPGVFATESLIRGLTAQSTLRHRYERPLHATS